MLFRMGIYTGIGAGAGEAQSRFTNMPRPDIGRAEGAFRNMTVPPPPPTGPVTPGMSQYGPALKPTFKPGGKGGGGHWEWEP
jgi:hypothetical protein